MGKLSRSQQERLLTAAKFAIAWLVLMSAICVLAGRFAYGYGWIFGGLNLMILVFLSIFFPEMPTIMRERAKPGPATKSWDRIFWALFGPMNLLVFVLAVLDGGRFQWTRHLPLGIAATAACFYVLGATLHFAAIRTNTFYSSTVSIHSEQGHTVIRDGPYRFVRHPGYSGILLMMASIPLVLGSLWALLPAGAVGALILSRTLLEDKSLKAELPGYQEYAQEVRAKLFPGIW